MKDKVLLFSVLMIAVLNMHAQNVGIGNVSPLMTLHVSGTDSAVALLENTQALLTNVSNALYFKTGNGGFPYTGAIKTIGESTSAARLGLFTYTSTSPNQLLERLSITDIGKVGIGVTTPQTALHINPNGAGSFLIGTNKASGGYTNLEMGISSQSNGYGYVQATKTSGSSYGNLALNPNGGNIGIGTTTPIATMDIHGGIALPIKVITNDYTVQTDDYTVAIDMQHDTNKLLVNVYLPATLLSHGKIINIIAINMDPRHDYNNYKNLINIYDASGNTLMETLEYQEDEGHSYNTNISAHQTYFRTGHTTAVTFQCIGAVAWVVIGKVSKEDRVEFTN